MAIYVQRNDQKLGPYTLAEVRSQLASGALSLKDHVWWTGQQGWVPLVGSPVLKPGFEDPEEAAKPKVEGLTGLSPFAVAAVIAGALFPLAFFTSVPAIIFGHCGLYEMKQNPGRTGRRMAIVGLSLGYVFTLAWAVAGGCWLYFREDIDAQQLRKEVVESQPFVPPLPGTTTYEKPAPQHAPVIAPTPVVPSAPATNAAPMTNAAPTAPIPAPPASSDRPPPNSGPDNLRSLPKCGVCDPKRIHRSQ